MTASKSQKKSDVSDDLSDKRIEKAMRGTRGKLIRTALEHFAKDGIRAVSLRVITIESGALNKSAIQYHFDGRTGLTLGVLDYVMSKITPLQLKNLEKIEQRFASDKSVSVRAVLMALYEPLGLVYQENAEGRQSIQFLSRLMLEADKPLQDAFGLATQEAWQAAEKYLLKIMPDKDPKALQTHLIMSMVNVIQGLADINIMHATPFGDMSDFTGFNSQSAAQYFLDYVEAGLKS